MGSEAVYAGMWRDAEEVWGLVERQHFRDVETWSSRRKKVLKDPTWLSFIAVVQLFGSMESQYSRMAFLKYHWPRKDALQGTCNSLVGDAEKLYSRIEAQGHGAGHVLALQLLLSQVCVLARVRIGACRVYRTIDGSMLDMGGMRGATANVDELAEMADKGLTEPLMVRLRATTLSELRALGALLRAQVCMAHFEYKDAVLALHVARENVDAWRARAANLYSSSGVPRVRVLAVCARMLGTLRAKMRVVFAGVFARYAVAPPAVPGDPDHVATIAQFCQRSGVVNVSVVLEAANTPAYQPADPSNQPAGYVMPTHEPRDALTGLRSFPALYSAPSSAPLAHWPNVISLLVDSGRRLERSNAVFHYERLTNTTYVLSNLCVYMKLVIILSGEHSSGSKVIAEFVSSVRPHFRLERVFDV